MITKSHYSSDLSTVSWELEYKIVIWQHWPQDLPIKQYNISPVSPPSILANQTISQQSTPQSHSDNNGHSASLQVSNTGRHVFHLQAIPPAMIDQTTPPGMVKDVSGVWSQVNMMLLWSAYHGAYKQEEQQQVVRPSSLSQTRTTATRGFKQFSGVDLNSHVDLNLRPLESFRCARRLKSDSKFIVLVQK